MPARAATKAKAKKRPSLKKKTRKTPRQKAAIKSKPPKIQIVGRVSHYYDNLGVAIIELAMPLRVGEVVLFKRGDMEHAQPVVSMQIDHLQVAKAKKGDVIGLKVSREIPVGTLVMPG